MRDLTLNGLSVHASELTQRSYRAVSCDVLLNVTPANQSEALEAFRNAGEFGAYRGLRISGIDDLSFLKEFPDLLYLQIVGDGPVSTRDLEGLANLRGLQLESPGGGIDFAWFPQLEVFRGGWHADHRNLALADELRRLSLRHFKPRQAGLGELANITRLENLELTQTAITSLDGIETLEDLRYLDIAYAPKLESLDALSLPGPAIREIAFQKIKNIRSYQPVAAQRYLRRLKVSSCAPMPDLKWTAGMYRLDMFTFVETNVIDGDLSPLLALPRLRYVGTMDKKHYSMKSDALNEVLEQRYVNSEGKRLSQV